jgi:hypothetical protein
LQACKRKEKKRKKEKNKIRLSFPVVVFKEDARECSTIISIQCHEIPEDIIRGCPFKENIFPLFCKFK